jgi:hypothetical protein
MESIAKDDAEKQLLVAEEFVNAVEDFVNKSKRLNFLWIKGKLLELESLVLLED